jgi:Flp pilus assembly protein TadD
MDPRIDPDELRRLHDALRALQADEKGAELDPAVLVAAAGTALRARAWANAIDLLRVAVAIEPASARAWALLGAAFEGEGRLDDAARAYGEATNLDDDDLVAALALASVQARRGRKEQARALAEHVILRERSPALRAQASALLAVIDGMPA